MTEHLLRYDAKLQGENVWRGRVVRVMPSGLRRFALEAVVRIDKGDKPQWMAFTAIEAGRAATGERGEPELARIDAHGERWRVEAWDWVTRGYRVPRGTELVLVGCPQPWPCDQGAKP